MKMMKYLAAALLSALMISPVMAQDCCGKKGGSDKSCSRMIQTTVPERPAGQQDMLAFRAPKLQTVRIGIIGLGMRGVGAVDRLSLIEGTDVVALCDYTRIGRRRATPSSLRMVATLQSSTTARTMRGRSSSSAPIST